MDAPGDGVTTTIETSPGSPTTRTTTSRRRARRATPCGSRVTTRVDRPDASIDPQTRTTIYGYDAAGNRTLVRTPLLRECKTEYDARNLVTREIDPLGPAPTTATTPTATARSSTRRRRRPDATRRAKTDTRYEGRDLPWTETTGSGPARRSGCGRGSTTPPATCAARSSRRASTLQRAAAGDRQRPLQHRSGRRRGQSNEDLRLATKYATVREYSPDNLLTADPRRLGRRGLATRTPRRATTAALPAGLHPQQPRLGDLDGRHLRVDEGRAAGRPARRTRYYDTGWITTATEPESVPAPARRSASAATPPTTSTADGRAAAVADRQGGRRPARDPAHDRAQRHAARAHGDRDGRRSPRKYTYRSDPNHNLTSFKDECHVRSTRPAARRRSPTTSSTARSRSTRPGAPARTRRSTSTRTAGCPERRTDGRVAGADDLDQRLHGRDLEAASPTTPRAVRSARSSPAAARPTARRSRLVPVGPAQPRGCAATSPPRRPPRARRPPSGRRTPTRTPTTAA